MIELRCLAAMASLTTLVGCVGAPECIGDCVALDESTTTTVMPTKPANKVALLQRLMPVPPMEIVLRSLATTVLLLRVVLVVALAGATRAVFPFPALHPAGGDPGAASSPCTTE